MPTASRRVKKFVEHFKEHEHRAQGRADLFPVCTLTDRHAQPIREALANAGRECVEADGRLCVRLNDMTGKPSEGHRVFDWQAA